jgi:hypothetical protein
VALRSEIIDLIRADICQTPGKRTGVAQIGIVEKKAGCCVMGVNVKMVDPICIEG